MSSSSTRSSRNNQVIRRYARPTNAPPPRCDCPYRSKERMSWTDANPGRRFYNCPFSLSTCKKPCEFFDWIDGPLDDPYYKGLTMRMKAGLDRRDTAAGVLPLKEKIEELECQIDVLESLLLEEKEKHMVEVMKLKTDVEVGKGKMKMAEMVILMLGLLVLVVLVMLLK